MVIWVLRGKLLISASENDAGRRDHAIDREAPVRKPSLLQALELCAQGIDWVCERIFRNLAASKFARQRVASEYPLRSIGQSFARAVKDARIGWDQSITLGELRSHSEPCGARGGQQAGGQEFTS